MVAPMWDDMYVTSSNSGVYTGYFPDEHVFVVEWYNLRLNGFSGDRNTFEMILYDPEFHPTAGGDGEIVFQYMEFNNTQENHYDFPYCSIGFKNGDSTDGLTLSNYNMEPETVSGFSDGRALRITTDLGTSSSEDLAPPTVVHTGHEDVYGTEGPWNVEAEITDYSGISSAVLEYRINEGSFQQVPMSADGDTYSAEIPGPAPMSAVIQYHFIAVDASPNENSVTTFDYSFNILPPIGQDYCQDFEDGFGDFTVETWGSGNTWTITGWPGQGNAAEITYSSYGQEDHAALITPVFDCSDQSVVTFSFWQSLRMGFSGSWTDAYVRGSVDAGETWPILIREWHSDGNQGDLLYEGTEEADISTWAAGENLVRLMFEFHDEYDWYWVVDDVCLIGLLDPGNAVELSILIRGSDIHLDWEALQGALSYNVYHASKLSSGFERLAGPVATNYVHRRALSNGNGFYYVTANLPDGAPGGVNEDPERNRRSAPPLEKPR